MKRTPPSLSRSEFLKAFASLVVYASPAVVALEQLGCSGGNAPLQGGDGGSSGTSGNAAESCSYSGTSISCSSISYTDDAGCSVSGTSISC